MIGISLCSSSLMFHICCFSVFLVVEYDFHVVLAFPLTFLVNSVFMLSNFVDLGLVGSN